MGDAIHSRRYQEMRAELKAIWRTANAPCWLCGQPIAWDGSKNEPDSFELDHAQPRKTHPHLALDRTNARPSHHRCNRSRGTSAPRPASGQTSEAW